MLTMAYKAMLRSYSNQLCHHESSAMFKNDLHIQCRGNKTSEMTICNLVVISMPDGGRYLGYILLLSN